MILAIDIGNTNIVNGISHEGEWLETWRCQTSNSRTVDEYGLFYLSIFQHHQISPARLKGIIIASVVPPLSSIMEQVCQKYFNITPLHVGPGIKTGISILYENPREVGADRIVNAVAAFHKYQKAGIIVDFGTATTFDAIREDGAYLGGVIAPGINISAEALFQRASKLPRVEIKMPEKVIGRNTISSMQSGLFHGYVGLVDGIVHKIQKEIGTPCFTIATGGLAPLFFDHSETIEAIEANLTLEGLRILFERNT